MLGERWFRLNGPRYLARRNSPRDRSTERAWRLRSGRPPQLRTASKPSRRRRSRPMTVSKAKACDGFHPERTYPHPPRVVIGWFRRRFHLGNPRLRGRRPARSRCWRRGPSLPDVSQRLLTTRNAARLLSMLSTSAGSLVTTPKPPWFQVRQRRSPVPAIGRRRQSNRRSSVPDLPNPSDRSGRIPPCPRERTGRTDSAHGSPTPSAP